MSGTSTDEPSLEIGRLLLGLFESLRQHMSDVVAELGLTATQLVAIRNLDRPCSQRDLAGRLGLDASSVTDIADELEARGFLRRRVDPADRRVRLLELTPAGIEVGREFFTRMVEDAPPLRGLTPAERATLQGLLAKMVEPRDVLSSGFRSPPRTRVTR